MTFCGFSVPVRRGMTCHRRFQQWVRSRVFEKVLQALAADLRERGRLNLSECFIGGTFIVAKKGAR
jgi:hypothetical protein